MISPQDINLDCVSIEKTPGLPLPLPPRFHFKFNHDRRVARNWKTPLWGFSGSGTSVEKKEGNKEGGKGERIEIKTIESR